jgi:hypothetical protein
MDMLRTDMASLPKPGDVDLEQRIRHDLAFLFDEYGAVVSSNTLDDFGISEVTVAVGNVEFKFEKNDREQESKIAVGPRDGHGLWEPLHVALAASTGEDAAALSVPISYNGDPTKLSYIGLSRVAANLKRRFELLNGAFASENYPTTRARMAHMERTVHPK